MAKTFFAGILQVKLVRLTYMQVNPEVIVHCDSKKGKFK